MSCLQYLDVNNLFGWSMLTNQITSKDFIKKECNEESDEGYFLEVDIQLLERLHEPHNDLGRKACS